MPNPSATRTYHRDTYPAITPTLAHLSTAGESAFISGAGAGGIGASIAPAFARSGISTLGLIGRNESRLLETKQAVQTISPSTTVNIYTGDVTDFSAVQRGMSAFAATIPSGTIDILIANAGYMSDLDPLADAQPAEWWTGFEVNVLGNLHLVQAFLPFATAATGGDGTGASSVHNASAAIHLDRFPGNSSYQASKAAATKLFEFVAVENPQHFVVQVHPGLILSSGMADKFRDRVMAAKMEDDTGKFLFLHYSPLSYLHVYVLLEPQAADKPSYQWPFPGILSTG